MYCRVIAISVRLFKAFLSVVLGAAMTVNSIAMASMRLTQPHHIMVAASQSPVHTTMSAMSCHEEVTPVAAMASQTHIPDYTDKQSCMDVLCCSMAMVPLRLVLTLQANHDSAVAQFFYVDRALDGYFARPDPPPRPVI